MNTSTCTVVGVFDDYATAQRAADRLSAAGVPVRVTNYLGTVHGFLSFPGATVVGHQARLELVTELRRHLT